MFLCVFLGSAKFIEFEPTLKVQDVQLSAMANFVIIQSLVTKNKAASSDFNTRVVECRLAAQVCKQAVIALFLVFMLQNNMPLKFLSLIELVNGQTAELIYKNNAKSQLKIST